MMIVNYEKMRVKISGLLFAFFFAFSAADNFSIRLHPADFSSESVRQLPRPPISIIVCHGDG